MALTKQDKEYIESTFDSKMKHYIGVVVEEFQGRVTLMGELFEAHVRTIVHEEVTVIMDDRITPIERKMDIFQTEMMQLRKDHNAHVANYALHR